MLGIPWEKNAVDGKISIKVCKQQGSRQEEGNREGEMNGRNHNKWLWNLQKTKGQREVDTIKRFLFGTMLRDD